MAIRTSELKELFDKYMKDQTTLVEIKNSITMQRQQLTQRDQENDARILVLQGKMEMLEELMGYAELNSSLDSESTGGTDEGITAENNSSPGPS